MVTFFYHDWVNSTRETSHLPSTAGVLWLMTSLILCILSYIAIRKPQKPGAEEDEHTSRCSSNKPETMTLEEAYRIKTRIAERDFPIVFSAATNSVFFKAEGIPSIAKLVARAAKRSSPCSPPSSPSSPSSSSSRTQKGPSVTPLDLLTPPGSRVRQAAIARVNYIHSFYRPSGKMSDDDLLYVLCLFALEPVRWVSRFEWRELTLSERCALATLWKAIGEELGIPFTRLPSCSSRSYEGKDESKNEKDKENENEKKEGEDGFTDALHWLAELEAWGCEYEREHRAKIPESIFLGQKQLDAWTQGLWPRFVRRWARGWVAALIEPGLRRAVGIEDPSADDMVLVETIIYVRKLIRRCFYALW